MSVTTSALLELDRDHASPRRTKVAAVLPRVDPARAPLQRLLKRGLDLVLASLALVVLAPFLLLVAVVVRLTSPGPALFRQLRVGQHGRPFQMLKFRSMVVDAEQLLPLLLTRNERTGPVFKMRRDPRVTRVGSFIRRFSIDELPQLLNVFRGDMSLVGPRPPVPDEVVRYEAWHLQRLSVPPGLTCSWQVTPDRCEMPFEQWVLLDLAYIDGWHLGRDLALLLRTIPAVLSGRGQC